MARVVFIHLDGDPALLGERMRGREGHFMPVTLLPSQLATLEPLTPEELGAGSLRLDITRTPEDLVQAIKAALHLPRGRPSTGSPLPPRVSPFSVHFTLSSKAPNICFKGEP